MQTDLRQLLDRLGRTHGTPCYVYLADPIRRRFELLREKFGGRFEVSYAVKANPNVALLTMLADEVATFDVSSIAEAARGMEAGVAAADMTFSGPAKRRFELARAVEIGIGEMVCESADELAALNQLCAEAGKTMAVFPRINPARVPRHFGVNMGGRPTAFGIDEEDAAGVLERFSEWPHLELAGFHIYSGTNCLDEAAISENFGIFIELFGRLSRDHGVVPRKLIFGSGFGVPYHDDSEELDIDRLAGLVNPQIDAMRDDERLGGARCVLEMGRWLVGPHGYLLTSVVQRKLSRGTEIRMCDAGFNNHLAACGMMGTIIRRNWRFVRVSRSEDDDPTRPYMLVGPLCTTIDMLAQQIELPELRVDDILAIEGSGAYGVTASPTRFISHPEPRELLVSGPIDDPRVVDVTESMLNWPPDAAARTP